MIQSYFQQHPFRSQAASVLEKDAELALHLVLFLLSSQNESNGAWSGMHVGATMRNTCHALEALHLLGPGLSSGAVETGIAWLINLPEIFDFGKEEEISTRLYPSRFKTLAWLGAFDDWQVRSDFEELEEHLDEDGLLQGIIPKPLLGTMIYVDCLNHVEQLAELSLLSQERREVALNCIRGQVELWRDSLDQNRRPTHLITVGDLSYALDLLFRAQILGKADPLSQRALEVMVGALEQPEGLRSTPSDILYCGIQLATHFSEVTEAAEAVRRLIDNLRTKYEQVDLRREAAFFHPLVLRLMLAYHGDPLKAEIVKLLMKGERQNLALREQDAEQQLKEDFQGLIKRRFEVEVSQIEPLSGGITAAEVYRAHFHLQLSSISEREEIRIESYHPSPGSLVIKSGSPEALRQSIEQYRNLPAAVKSYFAKHEGNPRTLQAGPSGSSYLVMEDLTYMSTFQDILSRLDQGTLSDPQKDALHKSCRAICDGLFHIYDETCRNDSQFFGAQLSRLYMGNLEQSLIRMCRPDKFPHLKTWLRGFWLGERKYPSVEHYLRKLDSFKARLKVPCLMLIHGDCHSRNIMLDNSRQQLRLIDLEHLNYDGDYIQDIALLLEDVAVFRFLFDQRYRFHLDKSQIRFVSDSPEQRVIENRVEYRAFSTEAVRHFQRFILSKVTRYARRLEDPYFKERLWLALAGSLMTLVAKQREKEYASVLYVEAIKLLDSLVSCFENGEALPDIPFPGQHPAGVKRSVRDLPAWYQDQTALTRVHDGLMSQNAGVKFSLAAAGRIAQYFVPNAPHPFAVIDGKKQSPSVLLACPWQELEDPADIARHRETSSALKTMVRVSSDTRPVDILALLDQVIEKSRLESSLVGGKEMRGLTYDH